jgi:hypothetical protein
MEEKNYKIEWIEMHNCRILKIELLDGMSGNDLARMIVEVEPIIISEEKHSVITLLIVGDISISPKVLHDSVEFNRRTYDYRRHTVIVGITGMKKYILNVFNDIFGRQFTLHTTENDALSYIAVNYCS